MPNGDDEFVPGLPGTAPPPDTTGPVGPEELTPDFPVPLPRIDSPHEKLYRARLEGASPEQIAAIQALVDDWYKASQEEPDFLADTGLINLLAATGVVVGAAGGAAAPWNTWLRQYSQLKWGNEIVSPGEAIAGEFRGVISEEDATKIIERHGIRGTQETLAKAVARPLLGVGEAITLWRRGYLNDDNVRTEIGRHGYTRANVERILTASEVIPSVQDTIVQLVREVFNPGLREELELDFEYPEAATEQFARLGVSEESAKQYWAAHWRLPSATQAYSMLHRGEIQEPDLEKLLKTLDYSTKWRERLQNIAYKLLTRVDIRRMNAIDVLDLDQVKERYKFLGYSEDDAKLMTEFTKRYNAAPAEKEVEETRNLTRAQVLRFFDNGILDPEPAVELLKLLNYAESDARSMVELRQLKASEDLLDDAIELVRRRFKNGAMPYNDAVSELSALDIPDSRKAIILQKLEQERLGNIKLPTLAQLNKFLKKGIITPDIYEGELARLGYPDVWAAAFMQLMTSTPDDEDPLEGTLE